MSTPPPSTGARSDSGLLAAVRDALGRRRAAPASGACDAAASAAPTPADDGAATVSQLQQRIEQLERALQAAEEASHAKSRFLGRLSHEIRTPMNGVMGMTQLLAQTPLDGTQRNYLELIERSTAGLLGLLGELLDFARLDAGELALQPQAVPLRVLLDEVAAAVEPRAHDKRLLFECHLAPDLPPLVQADPQRLRQVCLNLLHNAIKFTSVGQVVLAARREAGAVLIEVSDTGQGVPADLQQRIFTPFVQGDDSLARRQGGIGLGLSLVSTLVRAMDGRIALRSESGRGASFQVVLPLPALELDVPVPSGEGTPRPWNAAATPPGGEPGLGAARKPGSDPPQRVALVSDAPASQAALRDRLLHLNHAVAATLTWRELAFEPEVLEAMALDAVVYDEPVEGWPAELVTRIASGASRWRVVLLERRPGAALPADAVRLQRPLSDASLTRALAVTPGGPVVQAPAVALPRGKVLLVEDNEINQVVARSFLEHLGFEVEVAADADAALAALRDHDPLLALMDCQLPGTDGYELTRRLRAGDAGPRAQRMPVIALTAHATAADRERCLQAGMNDYIAKPVRQAELAATLSRWLGPARP
ncbi:MAG: response regulator [Pseudomonadota bacterium]